MTTHTPDCGPGCGCRGTLDDTAKPDELEARTADAEAAAFMHAARTVPLGDFAQFMKNARDERRTA